MKKAPVKVDWRFAVSPPAPKMVTLTNGQQIAAGVAHVFYTEDIPATKIWCSGCREYFSSWTSILKRHDMAQRAPQSNPAQVPPKKKVVVKKSVRVTLVPMPNDIESWPTGKIKNWLRTYRPDSYQKIFGKEA